MARNVTIIDYGYGNIRSVAKACEHIGFHVTIADNDDAILKADSLILPGQGSFYHCAASLQPLSEALLYKAKQGTPLLGICVGMQLFANIGYEYKQTQGLGLIEGAINIVENPPNAILPHMGWGRVYHHVKHPVLRHVHDGDYVYFVHSYRYFLDNDNDMALHADYGGVFPAAIARDNIIGCQFHPEKSQQVGLKILEGFYAW